MKKLLTLLLLLATVASCMVWKSVDNPVEEVHKPTGKFSSKRAIIEEHKLMWTGLIDSIDHVIGETRIFVAIHNSCSGFYCPELYIYQQERTIEGEWRMAYFEEVGTNGSHQNGPRKITIEEKNISLLNYAGDETKRFMLDSILLKE